MYRSNSVDFNSIIKLKDIPSMSKESVFHHWLVRVREYYLNAAKVMDGNENGFASLILQLCAIDSLSTIMRNETTVEDKIRNFSKEMLIRSVQYSAANDFGRFSLNAAQIDLITSFLYYQYRCGLVHNGFTVQVGQWARNNIPDHIFLISYEIPEPFLETGVSGGKTAFMVNPKLLNQLISYELSFFENLPDSDRVAFGTKIVAALGAEIAIASTM